MTEDHDEFLPYVPDAGDVLFSEDNFAKWHAEKFENEIVRFLYSYYRVPSDVRRELAGSARSPHVTVEQVTQRLGFPMRCGCTYIGGIARLAPLSRVFSDFANRKFTKLYMDFMADDPAGVPPALIFNWPHLGGLHALAIHALPLDVQKAGVRLFWVCPATGMTLTIEPISHFLELIRI